MAMTAGTVSVNPSTAVVSKSGYAGTRYDASWARYVAKLATFGESPPADIPTLVQIRQLFADAANDDAAIITYMQANATAGGDPVL